MSNPFDGGAGKVADASNKASKLQAEAIASGTALQSSAQTQNLGAIQQYLGAGQGAIAGLERGFNQPGLLPQSENALTQGTKKLKSRASASGNLRSGQTATSFDDFVSQVMKADRDTRVQRAQMTQGLGLQQLFGQMAGRQQLAGNVSGLNMQLAGIEGGAAMQNAQLSAQMGAGLGSLLGTGLGAVVGGPVGAAIGGTAGGLIGGNVG